MGRFDFQGFSRLEDRRSRRLPWLVCLAVLPSLGAPSIISVPGDVETIQAAADLAVDGDEIEIAGGTYDEFVEIVGKRLTLRAQSSENRVQVLRFDLYDGADISLADIDVVPGGFNPVLPALDCVNAVSLTVDRCSFIGSTATGFEVGYQGGPGMRCEGTTSTVIRNSTFQGGHGSNGRYVAFYESGYRGGSGLIFSGCPSVVLEGCTSTGGNGGNAAGSLHGDMAAGGSGGHGLLVMNYSAVTGMDVELAAGAAGTGVPSGTPGKPYELESGGTYVVIPPPTPTPTATPTATPLPTPPGGADEISETILGMGTSGEILDQNGDGVVDVADIVALLNR